MAVADYTTVVQQLYIAYFGRPADPEAVASYSIDLALLNAPTTIVELAAAYDTNPLIGKLVDKFSGSEESQVLYQHGDNGVFVDAIYQYLLNRAPDAEGWAYWKGEIDSGRLNKAHAALAIAAGAMTNNSLDGLLISKKTSVAIEFTNTLDTDAEKDAYAGKEAAEVTREMLAKVSIATKLPDLEKLVGSAVETLMGGEAGIQEETEDEENEIEEEIEEEVEEEVEEEIEETQEETTTSEKLTTMTSGVDTISGTNKDDTFVATHATFGGFDKLSGAAGADTLQINVSGGATADTVPFVISSTALDNIESVQIANSGVSGKGYVFNATNWVGVKTLGLSSSSATGDTKFINVGELVDAEMKNGEADLGISYRPDVVSGTANHNQKLILDNVKAGTFTADAGIETVTIFSDSKHANTLTELVATGAKKLVIQTAADLTIQNPLSKNIQIVDASLSTGKVSLNLSQAAGDLTIYGGKQNQITGGKGNDTFIFDAKTPLDENDFIDGGDGIDTIKDVASGVKSIGESDHDFISGDHPNFKNFEVLAVTNQMKYKGWLDATRYGDAVKTVILEEGASDSSVVILAGGGKLILGAGNNTDTVGALTIKVDSAQSEKTATLSYGTAKVNISGNIVTEGITKFFVNNDMAENGKINAITMNVGSNNNSSSVLGFTGSKSMTAGELTATEINAAELGGALTMTVASKGTTKISGSKQNDTLYASASVTAISGLDGDDKIIVDGNLNKLATIDGGNGTDIITINRADIALLNSTPALSIASIEKVIVNAALGNSSTASNILDVSRLGSNVNHIVLTEENANQSDPGMITNLADKSIVELTETTFGNGNGKGVDTWGDNDVLKLSLKNATPIDNTLTLKLTNNNDAEDWGVVQVRGVENIIIDSNTADTANTADANNIVPADRKNILDLQLFYGEVQKKLTITGDAYLNLGISDGASLNFATIDASANTGGISIKGGGENQTITGSSGTDIINGSYGFDIIYGGAGDDVLIGGMGIDTDLLSGGAGNDVFTFSDIDVNPEPSLSQMKFMNVDSILDFAKGDKLDFSNKGTNGNFYGSNYVFSDFSSLFKAADDILKGKDLKYYFSAVKEKDGSVNGYLIYDNDGDAASSTIVMLMGVTELAYTDII